MYLYTIKMEREEAKGRIRELVEEAAQVAMDNGINFVCLTDKPGDDQQLAAMSHATGAFFLSCQDAIEQSIKDLIQQIKDDLDIEKPKAEA